MVKRTLLVLSILSLVLLMVGTSFAMFGARAAAGWCKVVGPPPPVFCPVDCPPYPVPTTIVKKWNCKIVTPYCPAPAPVVVAGRRGRRGRLGLIGGLATAIMTPFDVIFGGRGVFGCRIRRDGPCGPFFGPIPKAVVAIPRFFAAPTTGVFGALW
jgi:hypothetical protein